MTTQLPTLTAASIAFLTLLALHHLPLEALWASYRQPPASYVVGTAPLLAITMALLAYRALTNACQPWQPLVDVLTVVGSGGLGVLIGYGVDWLTTAAGAQREVTALRKARHEAASD